ncbi:Bax inhibitor-1/YccA family protein [Pseudoprevotella muciniphila]|uniref:Bax inhibitor-1/YccA family protein n=1 Tax=Pseudoprevotella muciniphila TaxID=2133944 RepID=A0A5P8E5Z9_9BACT|nr:Bax inhibitor-1/YccA family protein [Bacteroidaceae bacterium]QFQ12433.1 Bax inhibitor-1/YccA family protein [Pseudoprevotella muciniphila]
MQNYLDNNNYGTSSVKPVEVARESAYATLMRNVYIWMTLALVVTAMAAYYVASNESLLYSIAGNPILFWGLMIGELLLVIILSARIHKMSFMTAAIMFVAYSLLNGVTMSFIFLAYTESSIVTTFLITAGTFGAMALVGSFIKKDLSAMGRILIMALIGLIIATIVNIFLASDGLSMIINYAGVLIFVGLTAYDAQKIKQMLQAYGGDVNEGTKKIALMGSLSLYLDFINLFLYLLRILGNRN